MRAVAQRQELPAIFGTMRARGVRRRLERQLEGAQVRELKGQGMRHFDLAKALNMGRASVTGC
jgi:hypothetical protein